jgi:hypothetical protein
MATFELSFDEPLNAWLSSDSEAETKAQEALTRNRIAIKEIYGGTALGKLRKLGHGKHRTGFVVETDETTARRVARVIEAQINYPVKVIEHRDMG